MANPENPEGRVAPGPELEQLAAAVGEWGVLSPLIVAPVAALAARAGFTAEPGAQWVVLDGHRRHAAAVAAGVQTVPVVIREDLAEDDAAVMLLTDTHKVRLTPIEEARAYQRLVDSGLTQSKIATRLGVSQPVISKRLALLKLSPVVQALVSQGQVPVNDAAALITDDHELRDAIDKEVTVNVSAGYAMNAGRIVRDAESAVAMMRAVARAQAEAEQRGVEFINAEEKWPHSYWQHELRGEADIEAAAAAGTLVVGAARWSNKPHYYTTASVAKAAKSGSSETDKQRREATKARRAWLVGWLPTVKASAAALQERLAHQVLGNHYFDSNTYATAVKILTEAGLDVDQGHYRSGEDQPGTKIRPQQAYLMSLMLSETRLSQPYHSWTSTFDRAYTDLIIAAGYQPTAWEQERLAPVPSDTEEEGR